MDTPTTPPVATPPGTPPVDPLLNATSDLAGQFGAGVPGQPPEPKKPVGRPPGSKDSQPRKVPGQVPTALPPGGPVAPAQVAPIRKPRPPLPPGFVAGIGEDLARATENLGKAVVSGACRDAKVELETAKTMVARATLPVSPQKIGQLTPAVLEEWGIGADELSPTLLLFGAFAGYGANLAKIVSDIKDLAPKPEKKPEPDATKTTQPAQAT